MTKVDVINTFVPSTHNIPSPRTLWLVLTKEPNDGDRYNVMIRHKAVSKNSTDLTCNTDTHPINIYSTDPPGSKIITTVQLNVPNGWYNICAGDRFVNRVYVDNATVLKNVEPNYDTRGIIIKDNAVLTYYSGNGDIVLPQNATGIFERRHEIENLIEIYENGNLVYRGPTGIVFSFDIQYSGTINPLTISNVISSLMGIALVTMPQEGVLRVYIAKEQGLPLVWIAIIGAALFVAATFAVGYLLNAIANVNLVNTVKEISDNAMKTLDFLSIQLSKCTDPACREQILAAMNTVAVTVKALTAMTQEKEDFLKKYWHILVIAALVLILLLRR